MTLMVHLLHNILMERRFIRILHYLPEIIYGCCKKIRIQDYFPNTTATKHLKYSEIYSLGLWHLVSLFLL